MIQFKNNTSKLLSFSEAFVFFNPIYSQRVVSHFRDAVFSTILEARSESPCLSIQEKMPESGEALNYTEVLQEVQHGCFYVAGISKRMACGWNMWYT